MCHFEEHLLNAVLFQPLCAEWPLDANDSVFVFIMLRELRREYEYSCHPISLSDCSSVSLETTGLN